MDAVEAIVRQAMRDAGSLTRSLCADSILREAAAVAEAASHMESLPDRRVSNYLRGTAHGLYLAAHRIALIDDSLSEVWMSFDTWCLYLEAAGRGEDSP